MTKLSNKPFTFVDVETTGGNPNSDRITEIGIVRVENGVEVATYQSLVNPQIHIPFYIQQLTGINAEMVKRAPLFEDIKNEVGKLLSDSIFVAHNAAFDYSFVRGEFRRLDDTFRAKLLCTVRLSRALYPHYKSHNLTSLISRFNLSVENRHRAFDDAHALWQFFYKAKDHVGSEKFEKTASAIIKGPRLPSRLREKKLGKFTEKPGVYKFFGEPIDNNKSGRQLLYIGKSNSLKKRIYSHFTVGSQSKLDTELARYTNHIETIETAGVISALLLEAKLIKSEKPLLNKQMRKTSQPYFVIKETKNAYNSIKIVNTPVIPSDSIEILATFSSFANAKQKLLELCDEHELCPKLLGLDTSHTACFSYQIEKCKGACVGKENHLSYNLRFIDAFSNTKTQKWPFSGVALYQESNGSQSEVHVFSNWCLIGHIKTKPDGESQVKHFNETFDWDIYKIAQKILPKAKNLKVIKRSEWDDYSSSLSGSLADIKK